MSMRLSIFLDAQEGMTYPAMLDVARWAERYAFYGLYRSDHLAPTSGEFQLAATEAWTTLAGLARETSTIRLGTLITPLTFHHPAVLSKMVSTVAELSGGRVDISVGTGWNVGEHRALGLELGPLGRRFEMLEEYLQVLHGLWGARPFSFEGRYYRVSDILPRPLPVPRPRIIVGGHGQRKTPLLAARYADEYNIDLPSLDDCRDLFARLDAACREVGRDPATIERSVLIGVILGETEADVQGTLPAGLAELGRDEHDAWRPRPGWIAGTPERVAEWLHGYAATGVDHAIIRPLPYRDLRAIELLAAAVRPALDEPASDERARARLPR
jgi:F420-dependent oxidoreductase-like protein